MVAPAAIYAAKEATSTIPIVCPGFASDPVAAGLVNSLSRPGANLTDPYPLMSETDAKRLQLAMELVPGLVLQRTFAQLIKPCDAALPMGDIG